MNERIKALWWKARIGYNNQGCDPEVVEKFAELLVRECADIALREEHDPYECIKKHFGVE